MPKFTASAARAVTQTVRFQVEAENEDAAEKAASKMLESGKVEWPELLDGLEPETDGWLEGIEET
jgi:hypothetical protein